MKSVWFSTVFAVESVKKVVIKTFFVTVFVGRMPGFLAILGLLFSPVSCAAVYAAWYAVVRKNAQNPAADLRTQFSGVLV